RALAARLGRAYPATLQNMFGGQSKVPSDRMARWYLMWALAMNGHGVIPHPLLTAPWTARPNGPRKYLVSPPGAAWAAARLGQSDPATISAIINRLGRTGDPPWLDGDFVGALTVLTGQRFGYNRTRWRRWWAAQGR
ncbi:MAG: hypothetical protein OEQ29_12925, partial [Alphaproteobacteria bacterium]|nr:hypothetical protein [Alphaproteobacteria bacterium]